MYYSKENGLLETQYVFIQHNQLPRRWCEGDINRPFTIVETGFGTGLNFLAVLEAWQQTPEPKRPLHFVSIEKFPLNKNDIKQAHQAWPKLLPLKQELLRQYPHIIEGHHLLSFFNSKIKLSLIFGDVSQELDRYSFSADCWFLDGFAPSKNVDMWNQGLFDLMAERSKKGTTFATFTAAGKVKRGLQEAGFSINKVPGFGRKREMLVGTYNDSGSYASSKLPRWCIGEHTHAEKIDGSLDYDAVVVGAGLSGLTSAYSLAQAGLSVALIERNNTLASEASGQTQLAQYAKLPAINNKEFRYTLQSLLYSQRYFSEFQKISHHSFWHQTGLLQLAWNEAEKTKHDRIIETHQLPETLVAAIDAIEASKLSELPLNKGGLWYSQCGWLDPHSFAKAVSEHPNIDCITNNEVQKLSTIDQSYWTVTGSSQTVSANFVVIATANAAKEIEQLSHLPIKALRGQVTSITSTELAKPKCVVCGEGYLCPPVSDSYHIGATYDLNSHSTIATESDNQKNISAMNKWLPEWIAGAELDLLKGNAGLRCTTPDYMPIVGQVPVEQVMIERFPKLRHNANAHKEQYGFYLTNLYVNVGHGSKGLITTPLCAEYITSLILSSPSPFNDEVASSLSPSRFLIKDLIQRKR